MTKYIEGIPYYRHLIRYTLATGERRSMIRWSPGAPWVREEVARELCDRFGIEGIKPGSVTITQQG
jgi:hypothetical protein